MSTDADTKGREIQERECQEGDRALPDDPAVPFDALMVHPLGIWGKHRAIAFNVKFSLMP